MNIININNKYSNKLNIQNNIDKIKFTENSLQSITKDIEKNAEKKEEEQRLIIKNNLLIIQSKNENKLYKKIEPNEFCCYKRRFIYPKDIGTYLGVFLTLSYFTTFTILMTLCLQKTKIVYEITDNLKNTYNILICILWSLFLINVLLLIDVFSSDPGTQRGTPISKNKFINVGIKKVVGGKKYHLKYCESCNLIRDIRTFHCKICGICVEKHDHHCFRVSNCIGVYNYKKFYFFLNSTLIYLIIIFDLFFLLFVFLLDIQHIDVITSNRTTRETIKNKKYNVYNRGLEANCEETFCRDCVREM